MSEPRAGHFRAPNKENGRRIGKNAAVPIRHGAGRERKGVTKNIEEKRMNESVDQKRSREEKKGKGRERGGELKMSLGCSNPVGGGGA